MTARRPRRIAADEAHAWARNLRLGNPHAKLVLCMLTLYVDGDGACFVSIGQLADDCELAPETVRRRLAWLEDIGAVVRQPQWLDENGIRNGNGRGKRTSDSIRLLTSVVSIELRAKGGAIEEDSTAENGDGVDVHGGGAKSGSSEVSPPLSPLPALSLRAGTESSEPEPVLTPNPLSGGDHVKIDEVLEKDIADLAKAYPIPVTDLPKLRKALGARPSDVRRKIITAGAAYADFLRGEERKGRKRAVKDAHRWVASDAWQGYVAAAERKEAQRVNPIGLYEPASREARAILALARIARYSPLRVSDGRISFRGEATPKLLAMADLPLTSPCQVFERGSQNFAAWRGFINDVFAGSYLPDLPKVEVPWPWPPRADGTVYSGSDPPGLVDGTLATADDLKEFAKG